MTTNTFDILSAEEWIGIVSQKDAFLLASSEGGASYRRGDDLLYVHYPNGLSEYVLRKCYFREEPPETSGAAHWFPLSQD